MSEKIIAKVLVGSNMFGTAEEGSDKDYATIYACDNDDILGLKYKEHDDVDKDDRRYEIGKFIRLLMQSNPNMLEILFAPDDCIIQSSEEWEHLRFWKHKFLSTQIYHTFCGYARTQVKKSKGLNKKINWEKNRVVRKDVLDFCYVKTNSGNLGALPVKTYLSLKGYLQEDIGLSKIANFRDGYDFFYGNYKGIAGEDSNEVRLSSIPKGEKSLGVLVFNRDAYSSHCKDYREYCDWLEKRNDVRYNINKEHGQQFDGKNISHNIRLLQTVKEALLTGELKVRRNEEEVKYLLDIKHGRVNLEELVTFVEEEAENISNLVNGSSLARYVDFEFCHNMLVTIRKYV